MRKDDEEEERGEKEREKERKKEEDNWKERERRKEREKKQRKQEKEKVSPHPSIAFFSIEVLRMKKPEEKVRELQHLKSSFWKNLLKEMEQEYDWMKEKHRCCSFFEVGTPGDGVNQVQMLEEKERRRNHLKSSK